MIGKRGREESGLSASSSSKEAAKRQKNLAPKTYIGADTFKELVENSTVFVDKSLLIKEFIEDSGKVLLITYPRRWGKTINMDMLKTFLELEVDVEGAPLVEEQKHNRNIFEFGKYQDNDKVALNIWNEKELIKNYFGQYPVIALSFKEVRGNSYKEIENLVKKQVLNLYDKHNYLEQYLEKNKKKLSKIKQQELSKYLLGEIEINEIKVSLKLLSELFYVHFDKPVFILIDEYDTPINHANLNFKDPEEIKKTVELFRGILGNALKGNTCMHKGLVTGIMRIAKADLFSEVSNLVEYNILDREYAAYYGFTKLEVEELLNKYNVIEGLRESIKSWYNGYRAGSFEIYNPWSIIKCLTKIQKYADKEDVNVQTEILRSYWEKSGNVEILDELFKIPSVKEETKKLVSSENISFDLVKQFTQKNFSVLKEMTTLGSNYKINAHALDLLFSYLFFAGYLTFDEQQRKFRLPNNELKKELSNKLKEYYEAQYSVGKEYFDDVTDSLQLILDNKNNDKLAECIKDFENKFVILLGEFPKFKKISKSGIVEEEDEVYHANEDLVHSIMNYTALRVKTITVFATEIYLGKGRADIAFIDKTNNKAVVMEMKYAGSAEDGLAQIRNKEYHKKIASKYDTILLGVNVNADKAVSVEYEIKKAEVDEELSGSGIEENPFGVYETTEWHEHWNKYYASGVNKILELRSQNLPTTVQDKLTILPAKYRLTSDKTDATVMLKDVLHAINKSQGEGIIVVPYNVENKHWVGLIFVVFDNEINVIYLDSMNAAISKQLLSELDLGLAANNYKIVVHQEEVVEQKYANCGAELIENIISYLGGQRAEQEDVLALHSQLLEESLLLSGEDSSISVN